ncbi:putative phosphatidylglycerol/phosphatidylinositol transfer protein DDB_G0282179 [Glycine max]|uniref:putative phosphatidylglycerol/phosphatidylinositol transfer protein DDB_G0282179 n=1 Tax=Glycine max TaxID=3847 RepID=UPI000233C719|nr:putative phosphatidylglycerol/phosphatidylinositol transfer protein DDB_G0282179 [Glycine max]|eukprot:XP_006593280.2 putative phosphatidylglycerol/phosphatidylinositol transfer protein DDB_G0282179 [Glycine max]
MEATRVNTTGWDGGKVIVYHKRRQRRQDGILDGIRVMSCTTDVNYAVKVSGIEITPDPVVRARPATFKISAATGEAIYGGKWVTAVAYFGFVVLKEIHDFCEEISCPVATGSFVAAHTQKLPAFAPPGSYTVEMTLKNDNNEPLTCITFKFKIVFGSFVSDI